MLHTVVLAVIHLARVRSRLVVWEHVPIWTLILTIVDHALQFLAWASNLDAAMAHVLIWHPMSINVALAQLCLALVLIQRAATVTARISALIPTTAALVYHYLVKV